MTVVYVVVAYEAVDEAEVSVDWFDTDQRKRAVRRMLSYHRQGILSGKPKIVRTMKVSIPYDDDDDITDFLYDRVDALTNTVCAVAQIIPPMSDLRFFPTGGTQYEADVDDEEDEPYF